jgi:hypothetical protein
MARTYEMCRVTPFLFGWGCGAFAVYARFMLGWGEPYTRTGWVALALSLFFVFVAWLDGRVETKRLKELGDRRC